MLFDATGEIQRTDNKFKGNEIIDIWNDFKGYLDNNSHKI